jgi:hypothetical protein
VALVEWVRTNEEHVDHVADTMRQADVDEVWASNNVTPRQALEQGVAASKSCTTMLIDGVACVIFGLVVTDFLSGRGCPWMLASRDIMRHKRMLLKESPPILAEMMRECDYLSNYVHGKNTSSIRWLRWLGFTFDDPSPHGANGELFHYFHLGI